MYSVFLNNFANFVWKGESLIGVAIAVVVAVVVVEKRDKPKMELVKGPVR